MLELPKRCSWAESSSVLKLLPPTFKFVEMVSLKTFGERMSGNFMRREWPE
jgi:hypothetical protein